MNLGEWDIFFVRKFRFLHSINILTTVIFIGCISLLGNYNYDSIVFAQNNGISVIFDGVNLDFDQEPIIIESRTLVPMRKIFEELEASVTWDEESSIIYSTRGNTNVTVQIGKKNMMVNDTIIALDVAPIVVGDRTLIPARAISEAFGCIVDWDDINRIVIIRTPYIYHTILDETRISDDFRYENFQGIYNGTSIFSNSQGNYFGMERMKISESNAEEYASIVNGIAEKVPDVRVYSAIAPTASEFYAPKSYATNFLTGISKIYSRLSERITPINIEGALMENSDKYIFFKTDHHWTHLGSYYAYKEFCDVSGMEAAELDSFDIKTIDNFMGSWGRNTYNTYGFDLLNKNKDRMDLYMPSVKYESMSYEDMYLNSPLKSMQMLKYNIANYSIFLEGDYPLEVYRTDIQNGRSICVIKDSYGNAFSTWLANNYEFIFIVDYRLFNNNNANPNLFDIGEFYNIHQFDDLIIINYPLTAISNDLRHMLGQTWYYNYN